MQSSIDCFGVNASANECIMNSGAHRYARPPQTGPQHVQQDVEAAARRLRACSALPGASPRLSL